LLPARLLKHPLAERYDEPRLFCDRYEYFRGLWLFLGVLPAQQGLHASDTSGGELDLRLVMKRETVFGEGLAQALLKGLTVTRGAIQGLLEQRPAIAPLALGLVHGKVGMAQQRLRVALIERVGRG
jgi:hypothetical protein